MAAPHSLATTRPRAFRLGTFALLAMIGCTPSSPNLEALQPIFPHPSLESDWTENEAFADANNGRALDPDDEGDEETRGGAGDADGDEENNGDRDDDGNEEDDRDDDRPDYGDRCMGGAPLSYWPGDGDAEDLLGTNEGALQGGADFVTSLFGESFHFDGIDAHVAIPDSMSLDGMAAFSVEFWLKFDEIPDGQADMIVFKGAGVGPGSNSYFIYRQPDPYPEGPSTITAGVETASSAISAIVIPFSDTGQFHHLALTYDGAMQRLFLDCQLVGSAALSGPVANRTHPLHFGRRSGPGADGRGDTLDGQLDEVRMYARALTPGQVECQCERPGRRVAEN